MADDALPAALTAAAPASPKPATPSSSAAAPPAAPKPKAAAVVSHFADKDGLFKAICRSFMARKCSRGAACKHVHDPQLCSFFYRTGDCKFGDECRKNHFVTVAEKAAGSAPTEPSGDAAEKKEKKQKDTKKSKDAKKHKDVKPNEGDDAPASAAAGSKKKPPQQKKPRPAKKNTECFDPMTRPVDLRVTYDLGTKDDTFSTSLTSRDVLLAPNLFSDFKKGELYAKLVAEIEACGVPAERLLKLWHGNDKIDGTHLIADDKTRWKAACPTFDLVVGRVQQFFRLAVKATRFNWYTDTSQWKPFHFDAAAVKPEIAAVQNFTVGVSFGATRDAAFEHANSKTVVSFPQPDGCVYAFGRDTNVLWRHGILQDQPVRAEGRISVIAWGWIDGMAEAEPTAVAASSATP
ncbi:hypothetical protein PybrP1_007012 [[Pythium] brassicae (nom. inval.)]|nr:hypothetical protein PybrP1_007012 [[Pythium] brassicae (nom. inval.)]